MGQIERGERTLTFGIFVKVVNRLGVTIDYLLIVSVKVEDEQLARQLLMLMDGRTSKVKEIALNLCLSIRMSDSPDISIKIEKQIDMLVRYSYED